jgi:hypothetical protein
MNISGIKTLQGIDLLVQKKVIIINYHNQEFNENEFALVSKNIYAIN